MSGSKKDWHHVHCMYSCNQQNVQAHCNDSELRMNTRKWWHGSKPAERHQRELPVLEELRYTEKKSLGQRPREVRKDARVLGYFPSGHPTVRHSKVNAQWSCRADHSLKIQGKGGHVSIEFMVSEAIEGWLAGHLRNTKCAAQKSQNKMVPEVRKPSIWI